jgi:hypothetical protein
VAGWRLRGGCGGVSRRTAPSIGFAAMDLASREAISMLGAQYFAGRTIGELATGIKVQRG